MPQKLPEAKVHLPRRELLVLVVMGESKPARVETRARAILGNGGAVRTACRRDRPCGLPHRRKEVSIDQQQPNQLRLVSAGNYLTGCNMAVEIGRVADIAVAGSRG